MYCLVELDHWEEIESVNHIVMVSKSKDELENIKSLLEKKFIYKHFKIIDL